MTGQRALRSRITKWSGLVALTLGSKDAVCIHVTAVDAEHPPIAINGSTLSFLPTDVPCFLQAFGAFAICTKCSFFELKDIAHVKRLDVFIYHVRLSFVCLCSTDCEACPTRRGQSGSGQGRRRRQLAGHPYFLRRAMKPPCPLRLAHPLNLLGRCRKYEGSLRRAGLEANPEDMLPQSVRGRIREAVDTGTGKG